MKVLKILAIAGVALYVVAVALVFFIQSRIIFYPSKLEKDQKLVFSGKFSEHFLEIAGRARVHYLVFPVAKAKGVILYFHGNAGSLEGWGQVADELAQKTGREVWIFDYPSYGKSDGPIPKNEKIFYEIGIALLKKIRETHPKLPVTLHGRSIGTGISSYIATTEKVDGLILETPYLTFKKLAGEIMPWVPRFLVRYAFDNELLVDTPPNYPVLIVHGTEDEVIPYHHGKELFEELGGRARFIPITGGHHNNLSEHPEYWAGLKLFLD